jgi:cholesterol transport system auxiliary component
MSRLKGPASMRTALLLAPLLLAGCISLGQEPPAQLLTLSPTTRVAAGAANSGAPENAITVLSPDAPQKLRTLRVPVQVDAVSVAYIKDAQWAEAPTKLFQRLVSETLAAKTGRLVLDEAQFVTSAGTRLAGALVEFGIDEDSRSAVVVYDAVIVTGAKEAVRKQRFEARVPVAAIDAASVGRGLNEAANKVADDVAAWVGPK